MTRFADDDRSLLADAPLLAAMMVLAAGRRGNVRGTLAVVREYAAARERDPTPLLAGLLDGAAPDVRVRLRDRDALAGEAPAALRAAVELLAREATQEELNDYGRFVLAVAAAAASSGGPEREAALEQIRRVLAVSEAPG